MSVMEAFRRLDMPVTIYDEQILKAYNEQVEYEKSLGAVEQDNYVSKVIWDLRVARDVALNWARDKQEELREDDERGGEDPETDFTPTNHQKN